MKLEITVKETGKKNIFFIKVGHKIIGLVSRTPNGFAANVGTTISWEGAFLFSSPENAALYIAHAEKYIPYKDLPEPPDWNRYYK